MNMVVRVDTSSDYYEYIHNTKKIKELSKQEGIYIIVDKNNEIVDAYEKYIEKQIKNKRGNNYE